MASQAPKVDIVTKFLFLLSTVALLLAVYILGNSLVNTIKKNSQKGEVDGSYKMLAVEENLKPVGVSASSDAPATSAAPVAARSGKEVYTAVCAACHVAGVAGAPKLDDKAAWEPRVATGLDALMNTAINGKGAMPPRAGQNIGDAELKATILYMTKEAGFDLGGGAAPAPAPAKEEKPAESAAPKQAEPVAEKTAEKKEELLKMPEQPTAPAAPALAAATTEAVPAAKASGDGAALYTAKGCGACHGANAKTPIMPLYPKIAGQSKAYVTIQMTDIKSGKRNNGQSAVMKGVMAAVSDAEITAIADYISGL